MDALKASLDLVFRGMLDNEMFGLYQNIFQKVFVDYKPNLFIENIIEDKKYIDPIKEYFLIKNLEIHEDILKIASSLLNLIVQKRSIIIAGKPGKFLFISSLLLLYI